MKFEENNIDFHVVTLDDLIQSLILTTVRGYTAQNVNCPQFLKPKSDEPLSLEGFVHLRINKNLSHEFKKTVRICVPDPENDRYEYHYDRNSKNHEDAVRYVDEKDYVRYRCRCYEASRNFRCCSAILVFRRHRHHQ